MRAGAARFRISLPGRRTACKDERMAWSNRGRTAAAAWLFLLPNFAGFLVFTSLPVLASLALSFFEWDLFTPPRFVGLRNFATLTGDADFRRYAFNTGFLMLAIPVNMAGSLLLALALNQKLRGIVVFRTIYFLPSIVAGVGTYLLWRWLYNPDFGLINLTLRVAGIDGPRWLLDPNWAKPALMLMGFWSAVGGYNMILYLAALQGVPPELYEAANIDGAGHWQKFRHITWPMVSPTTFFILTMGLIGGFQGGFEPAYVMTGGGPAGVTTTVSYYIFNQAFVWNHMGYAAAVAWVLFAVVLAATLLNWRFGGKLVHY
jgi:multiple sugar transport system permease protein